MQFSLKILIFSVTLSVLELYLSTFGAVCKILVTGDHPAGQDLQKENSVRGLLRAVADYRRQKTYLI
jgi:hypothetical protein